MLRKPPSIDLDVEEKPADCDDHTLTEEEKLEKAKEKRRQKKKAYKKRKAEAKKAAYLATPEGQAEIARNAEIKAADEKAKRHEELRKLMQARRRGLQCMRSNDLTGHAALEMKQLEEKAKVDPKAQAELKMRTTVCTVLDNMISAQKKPIVKKRLQEFQEKVRLLGLMQAARTNKLASSLMDEIASKTQENIMT